VSATPLRFRKFLVSALRGFLNPLGIDLVRYYPRSFPVRREVLLERERVSTVLDVGANVGQYAAELRDYGFAGRIISFEPLTHPFHLLAARAATDPDWECVPLAISDTVARRVVHVTKGSAASSLLPIAGPFEGLTPDLVCEGTELVETTTLDSACGELIDAGERLLLKLDIQGYELRALRGAAQIFEQTALVECELSLVAIYAGQPLIGEILTYLGDAGFHLASVDPGFRDPRTSEILQLDGLFVRTVHGGEF
jgi:FkbM family methyltransferase